MSSSKYSQNVLTHVYYVLCTVHTRTYIYIYRIHRERERERDRVIYIYIYICGGGNSVGPLLAVNGVDVLHACKRYESETSQIPMNVG